MRDVKVSCPFCGHANIIDLELYGNRDGPGDLIGLYDICEHCERVYAFDVELNYLTVSFDPKLSS